MKSKQLLVSVAGFTLILLSCSVMAQELSLQENIEQLEEKRTEITRIEEENESLKTQLAEHEVTIAEYREMIELLDEQIEQLQMDMENMEGDNS